MRYQVFSLLSGYVAIGPAIFNPEELKAELDYDIKSAHYPAVVLHDLDRNIVQVFKGDLEPFIRGLDVNYPGWKEGRILDDAGNIIK